MGKFGEQLGNLGWQTAGNLVDTGLGLLLEGHNDRRQLKQQGKLQAQQIEGQKQMTDYNMSKQLQMWKDTNYSAQTKEMEKAGLNPGLAYGMSGGGGATVGSANGSVSGAQAPSGGGEVLAANQLGLQSRAQTRLLEAQANNLDADTAAKQADATKKGGVDTENVKADTKLKGVQEENTRLDSEIKRVAGSVSRQTINEQMKHWENLVKQEEANIKTSNLNNKFSEETMDKRIEEVRVKVAGEILKNALTWAETKGTNAKTKEIFSVIANNEQIRNHLIQDLWINRDKLSIEKQKVIIQKWLADNDIGGENDVDIVLPIIGSMKSIIGPGASTNPVRGFHQR